MFENPKYKLNDKWNSFVDWWSLRKMKLANIPANIWPKAENSKDWSRNSMIGKTTKVEAIDMKETPKKYTNYWDWRAEENLPMDFFKNTSLHGLKYIGEKRQHIVERIFWCIAFLCGLVISYYMISDVWKKYRSNSVIISFEPLETKIEKLPFPAVTICNMNKVLKSKAEEIIKKASNQTRNEAKEDLFYLNHICSSSKSFSKMFNYSSQRGKIDEKFLSNISNQDNEHYDGNKETLWEFLEKVSPSCDNMILLCLWEENVVPCSDLFKPIETDYGFCCTFNMVPLSILHRLNSTNSSHTEQPVEPDEWEWDGDSLLVKTININGTSEYPKYPRRQKLAGKSFGLSILINPLLDEYFCTTSDSIGFRMVTHLPIDVPHVGDKGSAIKPNSEVFVNVRPEVTVANKEHIGSFTEEQRQCYFSDERQLGYYKYFTANNCIEECIANKTYEECNCVRFYMPRDDTQHLCGPKQVTCASKIKATLSGNGYKDCQKCYPTCTQINYQTQTSYTPLQNPKTLWYGFSENDTKSRLAKWAYSNVSIVHIYFGEDSTNAKVRTELYSIIDLVANFGGLMGLCLGFSGLSVVEVIYFLTLRIWFRKNNNANKNASSQTVVKKLAPRPTSAPLVDIPKSEMINRNRKDLNHILYTVTLTPDIGSYRSGCLQLGETKPYINVTPLESPSKKHYSPYQ